MKRISRLANLLIGMLVFLACISLHGECAAADPVPGLGISGRVTTEDGQGVPGVRIYLAFAAYWPGAVVAVTDENGYYDSGFGEMPGDETIRVHAERACYNFTPQEVNWRHYYIHEERIIDFTAVRWNCVEYYLPVIQKNNAILSGTRLSLRREW